MTITNIDGHIQDEFRRLLVNKDSKATVIADLISTSLSDMQVLELHGQAMDNVFNRVEESL